MIKHRSKWHGAAITTALMASVAVSQPPAPTVPVSAVSNLAASCRTDAIQAAANRISTKVTVGNVSDRHIFQNGAKFVPAADGLPAYCQVTGRFVTNPSTGKTARFLATFPENWNGKYLQLGCFGHCGFFALNDAASPVINIIIQGYPGQTIEKGYATFGTDEGHESASRGLWAVKGPGQIDDDAVTDFYYRADQVLARMGKDLTAAFYSRAKGGQQTIARSYFSGCSGGGRDAFVAASYFSEEFDGIIAGSAYSDPMAVAFQRGAIALAPLRSAGADISPDLFARLDPIVKAQCDGIDGIKDGLIQNPAACNFRPERDLPKCSADAPARQCFTDAQIETLSVALTAVTDERGHVIQPGMSVSELQYFSPPNKPADLAAADPFPHADADDPMSAHPWSGVWSNLKVFAHRNDPAFNIRSIYTFRSGGPGRITDYRAIVPAAEVAHAQQAGRMGIGSFPENAAKLIAADRKFLIWHNMSDGGLTPYMSINYYKHLAQRHGGYAKLQNNVRLFNLPGTGHCSGNQIGPNSFDALTAMENWVERGQGPNALVARLYDTKSPVIDRSKAPLRSMPLCKFPEMARYSGKGDVNDAANWSCPQGDTSMLTLGETGRRAGVLD